MTVKAGMNAAEVLRRYTEGERNFRKANLRGANFRGKDLSGADFSEADIRSANFTDAALRGVNFTKATAGLQRRWMSVQLLLVVIIAGIAGVFQGFLGAIATVFLDGTAEGGITFSVYLFLYIVV